MRFHSYRFTFLLSVGCCILFCGSDFPDSPGAQALPAVPAKSASVKPKKVPASDDAINQALDEMSSFDFNDTPLKEVVAQIASDHSISVKLDLIAIEDAGFDEEMQITGSGNGQSLRSALKLLFMEYDFVAIIKHHTLLITTMEAINNNPEKFLIIELYDITDLQGYASEDLIDTIQQTIDPQSWLDTNGGPATIKDLNSEKKIVLVISHTSNHHHEIVEFLDKLRAIEKSN